MRFTYSIILNICAYALLLAGARFVYGLMLKKFLQSNVFLRNSILLSLTIIFLVCFNVPFLDYSFCAYIFAFFDSPSLMSLCVATYYVGFVFLKITIKANSKLQGLGLKNTLFRFYYVLSSPLLFNYKVCLLWFVFGLVVYIHILGYGLFDIYDINITIQALFIALLSILSYYLSRRVGICMLVCIVGFLTGVLGDRSIFAYCFDPFLWLYCGICVFVWVLKMLFQRGR